MNLSRTNFVTPLSRTWTKVYVGTALIHDCTQPVASREVSGPQGQSLHGPPLNTFLRITIPVAYSLFSFPGPLPARLSAGQILIIIMCTGTVNMLRLSA